MVHSLFFLSFSFRRRSISFACSASSFPPLLFIPFLTRSERQDNPAALCVSRMARAFLSSFPLVAVVSLSSALVLCSAMDADDAGPQEGSTSLFAVFALSMLSLFVFPYTISKVVKAAAPERESRPWEKVSRYVR